MNKKGVMFLLSFIAIIFISSAVKANFVCGHVNDSNVAASWFDVSVYYTERPDLSTSCKISPEGNKYCCDPQQINGVSWAIGKNVTAKISEEGYFAGPVSLTISGEGYDIFPDMRLRKGILLNNLSYVMIGDTNISLSVSTVEGFNKIEYSLKKQPESQTIREGILCANCNEAVLSLENLSFGQYEIELKSRNEDGNEVFLNEDFWNLDSVKFNRKIECRKCNKNFVYSGEEVKITVQAEFSNEVSGKLYDYFPSEWTLLSEENIEHISESHEAVVFEIDGKNLEKTYRLRAPNTIFAKKYSFKTAFEDYKGNENEILLYRFYRFFPFPKKLLTSRPAYNYYSEVLKISPSNPLVLNAEKNDVFMAALFPKEELEERYAFLNRNSPIKLKGGKTNFVVGSNFDNSIEKVLIRYKIRKQNARIIDNVDLYRFNESNETWERVDSTKYSEDEDYYYYESSPNKTGAFSLKYDYQRVNE